MSVIKFSTELPLERKPRCDGRSGPLADSSCRGRLPSPRARQTRDKEAAQDCGVRGQSVEEVSWRPLDSYKKRTEDSRVEVSEAVSKLCWSTPGFELPDKI
jgi:hypothetical protein